MERTNTLPLWIGAIVLVLLVGGYFAFSGNRANGEEGTVYVTVSDAAANMGEVTEVTMTVDKIELRSATEGWVTVSRSAEEFELLSLNASGKAELAAQADIAADTYDQLRVTMSDVDVETRSNGTKGAVLVTRTLTIPGTVVVRANESSHVDVDVQTRSSLHTATDGTYVFAPVIVYTSSHGDTVTVANDNSVTSSGGTTDTNTAVGTDLSGNVVIGSQLSPSLQLTVSGNTVTAANATSGSGSGLIQINMSALLGGSASGSIGGAGSATSSNSGSGNATSSVRVQVNY